MRVSLLKAVRVTIRADSDPARQALFAGLRRASVAARLVYRLHARLGAGRASTLLVSLYGLKSYLEIAAPAGAGRLLLVAVHANARRAVNRVGSWFAPGSAGRLRIGASALLHPSVVSRTIALLASGPTIGRGLRVVHAVNQRHDFLVTCRVARVIACYARATAIVGARRWGAVVVSSDTHPEEVGVAAAARARGVPTLFIAHGYPSPFAPPLDFSLSLLEGDAAVDARRHKGDIKGEVLLLGVEGESAPMDPLRLTRVEPVIGILAPKTLNWPTFAETVDACRRRFGARQVVVRWHPSMLGAPQLDRVLPDRSRVVETPRSESLGHVLGKCDWVISDLNSNVHLAALKAGVPTVAVSGLGVSPDGRRDVYGFEAQRIVFPAMASVAGLSLPDVAAFYSGDWPSRFRRYDASYLQPAGLLERQAAERIGQIAPAPAAADGGFLREHRSRMLSLAVSALLLAALYRAIDARAVWPALQQARPGWLLASVGLIVPLTLFRAIRFAWVAPSGSISGVAEALRLTLVASAFNLFVPAKAGDLTKSFFVATRGGAPAGVAVAVVVYERLADLFGLIVWCLVAWVAGRPLLQFVPPLTWVVLGLVGIVCSALLLSQNAARLLPLLVGKLTAAMPNRLKKLGDLAEGWPALHRDLAGRRLRIVAFSIFLWLVQLTQVWLFAVTLSIGVPFVVCLPLAAVALMAGQLPLTFAGLGSRDLALVALLSRYTTPEAAAAMGLLTATRGFLPPLAGLFVLRPYLTALVAAGRDWRRR